MGSTYNSYATLPCLSTGPNTNASRPLRGLRLLREPLGLAGRFRLPSGLFLKELRTRVKKSLTIAAIFALSFIVSGARAQKSQAPAAAEESPIQKTVEAYLRNLYAFGPDTTVIASAPKDIGVEGLEEIDVEVRVGENQQTGKVYVSKDGKYMFRGELSDLSKDPMAENRAQLQTKDSP